MRSVHRKYMAEALALASDAAGAGEVPVGSVVVAGGEVTARARNRVIETKTATAHAELLALAEAQAANGGRKLTGSTLYSTLEPCPMCAYAAVLARVDRIVFGAYDPKSGACGSVVNIPAEPGFNHKPEVIGGVMEDECARALAGFFAGIRS